MSIIFQLFSLEFRTHFRTVLITAFFLNDAKYNVAYYKPLIMKFSKSSSGPCWYPLCFWSRMSFVCISGPCMPRGIRALMDCQSGSAALSWQPGTGAMQYVTTAVDESGHALRCESNNTNCELTGLACGESYNITVLAEGQTCSSAATMSGPLRTGEQSYSKRLLEYSKQNPRTV